MLRKTAFLLAYWGDVRLTKVAELSDIRKASILLDARHKDIGSTATYLSDSGTWKALVDKIDKSNPNHQVGRFEPIKIDNLQSFSALIIQCRNKKSLTELSCWFCQTHMKVNLKKVTYYQAFEFLC